MNENYIHFLVQIANQKMAENLNRIKRCFSFCHLIYNVVFFSETCGQMIERDTHLSLIHRFYDGLQAALQADESPCVAKDKHQNKNVVWNRQQRKTKDSVMEESQIPPNKLNDSEDYLETGLMIFS